MMQFLEYSQKIEELLKAEKKLIVYHRDIDGTTSAALFLKFLSSPAIPLEYDDIEEGVIRRIIQEEPEVVVILDMAIDQYGQEVKKLEKSCRVVIIDHHVITKNLNSKKTLHINPRFENQAAYLPSSYLVYHLLKKMGKPVKPYAWIAAIGVIGDYAFREGKDILEEAKKIDSSLLQGEPRASRLGEGGNLISAAISAAGKKGAEKALQALVRAEVFEDFESEKQLQLWKRTIEEEIKNVVKNFGKEKEYYPEKRCAFLELVSRYSLISDVSTLLAERYPDQTIVIRHRGKGGWKLSLRNQSGGVDLNQLVRKASQGIGTGGGHEKAAGGFVTDWEKFKKRFLELLK